MPIRFKKEKCIYSLGQEIIRPCVYFDTWVFNTIIRDERAKERISGLFNDDFGTLFLSDINIVEIISRGKKEICEISDFICNIPFIIFEDDPLTCSILKPLDIFNKYGVIDCIDQTQDFKKTLLIFKDNTSGILKQSQDKFVKMVNRVRENKDERKKMIELYEKLRNINNPSSKEISYCWIGYICRKNNMKIEVNDISDFYHICKPLVHCDVVTLDGGWKAFIDETFPELSSKIITDKRGKGIQLLFEKLENYKHV